MGIRPYTHQYMNSPHKNKTVDCVILIVGITIPGKIVYIETSPMGPFQYNLIRLIVMYPGMYHEVSKPRVFWFRLSDRSEIWHASRHHSRQPRRLSNFKAMWLFKLRFSRLRGSVRPYDNSSYDIGTGIRWVMNMPSYQYLGTIMSYLYNGNLHTWKDVLYIYMGPRFPWWEPGRTSPEGPRSLQGPHGPCEGTGDPGLHTRPRGRWGPATLRQTLPEGRTLDLPTAEAQVCTVTCHH